MNKLCILIGCLCIITNNTNAQIIIRSFNDIDSLIRNRSYEQKTGKVESDQARKANLGGLLSIPDPTGSTSLSYTNNTKLPVTVFPAEILGGTPGTYEKVALGVQYNSSLSANIDIKLFNPAGIQAFKLSKLNIAVTESENGLRIKELADNAATAYYNILTLQQQQKTAVRYTENARQLLDVVTNKMELGIGSSQDVNEAKVAWLNQQENIRQIQYQLGVQVNALKLLLNLPDEEQVTVNALSDLLPAAQLFPSNSNRNELNAKLHYDFARTDFLREKRSNLPTLSFNLGGQRQLFDTKANPFNSSQSWIPSSYYGLKLSLPIPGANSVSSAVKAKYQAELSRLAIERGKTTDALEVSNLKLNYEKAVAERNNAVEVVAIRRDIYEKNRLNYEAGVVNLEYVINSFTRLIEAEYAVTAAEQRIQLQAQLIQINNNLR